MTKPQLLDASALYYYNLKASLADALMCVCVWGSLGSLDVFGGFWMSVDVFGVFGCPGGFWRFLDALEVFSGLLGFLMFLDALEVF